jgi:sulfate transport system permease protein
MKGNSRSNSDLVMRSITLGYVGLLIILPVAAVSFEALKEGFVTIWNEISLPQAVASLRLTFILAFILVIINIITGTLTAWVLVRYEFPLKSVINALIDLPFAIPTIVTGLMLVTLYGPNSAIGIFLKQFDIEIIFNKAGIILALLFVTFPFVVRSVQPVLLEMEKEMEEAAKTLGASTFTIFFRVTLPTLFPSILTGAALSFSRALGEFGSVVIVAGNIPFKTLVAPVYVYGEIESHNLPGATSVSLFLLVISFLILIFIHFIQKWSRRHESQQGLYAPHPSRGKYLHIL